MIRILGLSAYHADAAAAAVADGKFVAGVEEERFRRIKHWAGFPSEAINQDGKANLGRKLSYTLLKRPDLGLVLDRLRNKLVRRRVQ